MIEPIVFKNVKFILMNRFSLFQLIEITKFRATKESPDFAYNIRRIN